MTFPSDSALLVLLLLISTSSINYILAEMSCGALLLVDELCKELINH